MVADNLEQKTLKEELKESIRHYPSNARKYLNQLGPSMLVCTAGAAFGRWVAHKKGYDSPTAGITASYIAGYVPGYAYFLGSEFLKNKDHYEKIFSKKFGEFASTFLAADYVSDMIAFTPAFISSSIWLRNNTKLDNWEQGAIAWVGSGLLYLAFI